MSRQSSDSLFSALRDDTTRLGGEVREMLTARWALLELELRHSAAQLRRLVVYGILVLILFLSGWPLLIGALADMLAGWAGLSQTAWAAIAGGSLVVLSAAMAIFGWRRWRGALAGFEESLAELREDVAWFGEWSGQADRAADQAAAGAHGAPEHDANEQR